MSRTNHRRLGYPTYTGHKPTIPCLGDSGLSVYRSINSEVLTETFRVVEEELGGTALHIRNRGQERPPAVNLLEVPEVKRQRSLGHVPVQDAINEIYGMIRSLRHEITATPAHLQFLGRQALKDKVLVVMLDNDTTEKIDEERTRILEILEGMADQVFDDYRWWIHKRPHISLARIRTRYTQKVDSYVQKTIEESLPESIPLQRSSFFYPDYRHPNDF